MGYRHTRDEILDGAVAAVFDEGLSRLTFGRLARRMAISDRVIVYYFPTKDELIAEVLAAVGLRLQAALAPALTTQVADHVKLVKVVWPVLATPEADPVFSLFFEAGGLAAAGIEPYATLVPQQMAGWIEWASAFIDGTPARRRTEASAAIATLDGLLLVRQLAGTDVADRAARGVWTR